jgi:hypothetical protein
MRRTAEAWTWLTEGLHGEEGGKSGREGDYDYCVSRGAEAVTG